MEEKMILIDSDEAASIQTVTGWVSRNGRFCGEHEDLARYDGCTHRKCDSCGLPTPKSGWLTCNSCRAANNQKKYNELPEREWNGEVVALFDDDTYFFEEEEFLDWCEDYEIAPESVDLVICEAQYADEIDLEDHLCDIMPEGMSAEDVLPHEVIELIEKANVIIRKNDRPVSYIHGNVRTKYKKKP